jgi:YD repeat-containing protein
MRRSLFSPLNLILLFNLFLCVSCSNDSTEEKREAEEKFQARPYVLNVDVARFIGNTAIPDFRFDEKFLREKRIKGISAVEKTVLSSKPADTVKVSPGMVWLVDSTGATKELQIYDTRGTRAHSEYFILPEELPLLAQKNIDAERSAATIYFYDEKVLKQEIRTEPTNADTTKYFYDKENRVDSVSVSSIADGKFYIRFYYDEEGRLVRREVRQPNVLAPMKNWEYAYDADGSLKSITEKNNEGGVYIFKWDIEGKLTAVEYIVNKMPVFKKTYEYDSNGLLTAVRLITLEASSVFEFGYAR